MFAIGLQMSSKVEDLAKRTTVDSHLRRLVEESGLTWEEASQLTFAQFSLRLAEVRAGRVAR